VEQQLNESHDQAIRRLKEEWNVDKEMLADTNNQLESAVTQIEQLKATAETLEKQLEDQRKFMESSQGEKDIRLGQLQVGTNE
jgi:hypothetical protein